MLKALVEHAYDPDSQVDILNAFRMIDVEGKGFVDVDTVKEYLTTGITGFREKELNDFIKFARDAEEPDRIYYEEYAFKLVKGVEKHLDKVYADVRGGLNAK
jgi:Ca2+-binding EF-hand superfamily protein